MSVGIKDRFLAACSLANADTHRAEFDRSNYSPRGDEREFYAGGALAENARLRPLLLAAAEVIEAATDNDLRGHKGRCALEAALARLTAALGEK